MRKRTIWLILVAALLLVAGGGYVAYNRFLSPAAETAEEPKVQTVAVQRGDLIITADGTGTLIPAEEVEVGFLSGG